MLLKEKWPYALKRKGPVNFFGGGGRLFRRSLLCWLDGGIKRGGGGHPLPANCSRGKGKVYRELKGGEKDKIGHSKPELLAD